MDIDHCSVCPLCPLDVQPSINFESVTSTPAQESGDMNIQLLHESVYGMADSPNIGCTDKCGYPSSSYHAVYILI